jgi:hypothetical protein
MSKILIQPFCFDTNKCISGILLLADEVDLRLRQHIKKIRLCARVTKMIAEVDNFGHKLEKLPNNEGQNPRNRGWKKYTIALMSFVNYVCKTLRGMIAILYKGGSLLYK